jgi:DNA polymerase III subunit delta
MKITEAQMARALDAPDGRTRLYLLYGPDDSASRTLAARIDAAFGADAERIDLDGPLLKEDPARLADEAAAISLFGGRRFIRVTGGDECAAAVAALLESTICGDPVVMIAGALKPASSLLKLALNHAAVLATQSYKPEGANADALAVALGRTHGVRMGAEVARTLARNALGDRAIMAREIEKIALYLDAAPDRPRDAGQDTLDAIGAGLDEADSGALVDAVMGGRLSDVAVELAAINDSTTGLIPVLRALARRLVMLARMRAEVDAGTSVNAVIAAQGKAVFYKDRDSVTAQLRRWDAARLRTASQRIFAVEAAIKAPQTAGDMLANEELIAIARVAQRLR